MKKMLACLAALCLIAFNATSQQSVSLASAAAKNTVNPNIQRTVVVKQKIAQEKAQNASSRQAITIDREAIANQKAAYRLKMNTIQANQPSKK